MQPTPCHRQPLPRWPEPRARTYRGCSSPRPRPCQTRQSRTRPAASAGRSSSPGDLPSKLFAWPLQQKSPWIAPRGCALKPNWTSVNRPLATGAPLGRLLHAVRRIVLDPVITSPAYCDPLRIKRALQPETGTPAGCRGTSPHFIRTGQSRQALLPSCPPVRHGRVAQGRAACQNMRNDGRVPGI